MKCAVLLIAMTALLAACGERPQTASSPSKKMDGKVWDDSRSAYAAPGWKGGDKAQWEAQIRARMQAQNDYVR